MKKVKEKSVLYNTMNIKNIALASLRHHTGLRENAEIATAALIDAKIITKGNTSLIIDHNKVKRAQEEIGKELTLKLQNELNNNGLSCIFFDGRKDDTKIFFDVEGRKFPGLIKEEHYTVCSEPGGNYLFHFVPEKSDLKKPAEIIADHLIKWLKGRCLHLTLEAIGCDSTNLNTGWAGGVIQWVEKKLNKKLVWIVCDLHTGELGLRSLIKFLDGPTKASKHWSGPLGKMLNDATNLEINPEFLKVCENSPLIYVSPDIIKDLSTDKSYAYQIVTSIKTGVLPKRLVLLEIGPVCHSRSLTTALRFCRI